ncbi:DUF721 domain-containing protein [uncultured Desulfovibrio sp.]|uniref:DUF721 domain-containing protein n=1 Tax=uncultured Desulfovibrio sp. TaxID=167968 RepID=UPI0003A486A6|nr:DUF721 domain-containing protein [uncultured Desulfovibrio sp.]
MKQQPQTQCPMRNLLRRGLRPQRKGGGPASAGDLLCALLPALGGGPERARLGMLWQNWEQVMGPELAPLALPLGHHKDMLLIGAEDAMLMQELHLMSGEILKRVNAFMENPLFTSVKVTLVLGKNVLNTASPTPPGKMPGREQSDAAPDVRHALQVVRPSGSFLASMDPASPVARCYARFAGKQAGKSTAQNVARKNATN